MTTETKTQNKKVLSGEVTSNGGDKTITVRVSRFVKHPKYGKYTKKSKKYRAHDEDNACQVGDNVKIEECKPISKDKRFRVI